MQSDWIPRRIRTLSNFNSVRCCNVDNSGRSKNRWLMIQPGLGITHTSLFNWNSNIIITINHCRVIPIRTVHILTQKLLIISFIRLIFISHKQKALVQSLRERFALNRLFVHYAFFLQQLYKENQRN
jgi:hypothetical protein